MVIALFGSGCISIDMGPERLLASSNKITQLQVQSVSRITPKIDHDYGSGMSAYRLELVAEGSFIRHKGYVARRGTPCLAFGLWPGCAGKDCVGTVLWESFCTNYGLLGTPTLASLVFEPFFDYQEKNKSDTSCFADWGLIGFSKYYRDVSDDPSGKFVEVSTEPVSSCTLYGYSVMIDGVEFSDNFSGVGYESVVYFNSSRPSGSRIVIRIVKPPCSRSDGAESFAELKDIEVMSTLP